MSMTYKEAKERLTDYGFEEDSVVEEEYKRIFINAFNTAGELIYNTVMLRIEWYIRKVEELESDEDLTAITKIDEDTADDDYIYLPDIINPLYPILAAHFAWLDDDLTKAMNYWNIYDDMKDQIMNSVFESRKATIKGGVRL